MDFKAQRKAFVLIYTNQIIVKQSMLLTPYPKIYLIIPIKIALIIVCLSYFIFVRIFSFKFFTRLGITIECLVRELSLFDSILQCWDEFDTLLSSFGLYKSGSSGSVFDRSLFLTIYNGKDFQHKSKSYAYEIKKPRFGNF